MTFLGKLLIYLQLVASIFFMAFACAVFYVQTDWKKSHDSVKKDYDDEVSKKRDALNQLEDIKNKTTVQLNDAKQNADKAQAALDAANRQLADDKKQLETTKIERNRAIALAETSAKAERERREEAQVEREINAKQRADLDQTTAALQKANDTRFNLEKQDKLRNEKHKELLDKFAFYQFIVRTKGLSTDPQDYKDQQEPPPVVEGFVVEAQADKANKITYVTLSLGSDDGLLKGHEMFVSRPGKYLGKIKIVHVTPDQAVGTVIQRAKNGIIEKGDHVSTKL